MRGKWFLAALLLSLAIPERAWAIPIFAQRYHLSCETCHSVIPELNDFGKAFRARGYRLPLHQYATTPVALRYQLEYEREPVDSRRYSPGGGPAGLYLGFLSTYLSHSSTLVRAGLIELSLAQSPGHRLDDLQPYGYYGAQVGLNDLTLASPRWGVQAEQSAGVASFDLVADLGEFKGAPYGGNAVPTGETTSAPRPEVALFGRVPVSGDLDAGFDAIDGERSIVLTGKTPFDDTYDREGVFATFEAGKFNLQGEQWWGRDSNADGFGTVVGSSGGYLRLKYYPDPHAYIGVRYDAYQNPFITRDVVYYGAFMIAPDARFLLQEVSTVGAPALFGGALTVGLPWVSNL